MKIDGEQEGQLAFPAIQISLTEENAPNVHAALTRAALLQMGVG